MASTAVTAIWLVVVNALGRSPRKFEKTMKQKTVKI